MATRHVLLEALTSMLEVAITSSHMTTPVPLVKIIGSGAISAMGLPLLAMLRLALARKLASTIIPAVEITRFDKGLRPDFRTVGLGVGIVSCSGTVKMENSDVRRVRLLTMIILGRRITPFRWSPALEISASIQLLTYIGRLLI